MTDASTFDTKRRPSVLDALSSGTVGGLLRLRPGLPDDARRDLPRALRGDGRLRHTVVPMVLAEWDRLRADRVAPARSELDPARLSTALEYMFVAEIIAPGVARLRLAGQHLYTLLGMEPRGMPLCCLAHPSARPELAEALRQVSRGVRVQLPLRAPRGLGRPVIDGLLVLLPLTDEAGRITRVLGVLETHGQTGRAPRRFELAGAAQPMPLPITTPGTESGSVPAEGCNTRDERAPAGAVPSARDPGRTHDGAAAQAARRRHGWQVIEGGREKARF